MTSSRDTRRPTTAVAPPAWAIACFLLSGAAGLLYEVVWGKQLAYLLGSSLHAVATVVAAFLGGLAIGARFLGAPLARHAGLARRYAALEAGIAVLGLLLLPLLRSLDGPVGHLYRTFGGESPAFAAARVGLLLLLLVPPASLMGATLPVLVARIEQGVVGAGLAWLYAVNTVGAVAGSVLGGFLLMPHLGLTGTTFVAAGLNLLAAGLAWRWGGREPAESRRRDAPAESPPAVLGRGPHAVFAVAFAVSGFSALLLQLAWVRLFGLVLGSSVYSFSAVLGVYLLGLALGSAAVARPLARANVATWWFALLQFALALTAVLGIRAYAGLPRAMLDLGERAGPSWSGLLAGELLLVAGILLVPCVLLGAAFPVATRLLQRGAAGATTGSAYAVNTLGTITGSLATGFVLLPALGVQGVVLLAAGLSGAVGLAALALRGGPRPGRRSLAAAVALLVAGGAAAITTPRWDPLLMSLGTFRPFSARNLLDSFRRSGLHGDPTRALTARQQVLYARDGINTSVLVVADEDRRNLWMRVGGKVDAGTRDMLTQVLLGLVPAALADSGARTLIVGHGSGVTAAAALAAGAGATEVVELEPAVIEGSRYFHERGRDPLDDARVTLHLEDARTRLEHGEGPYDVVISEPSNPWMAGVNNLFTVDFYRRVNAQLAPGGVFCQWLQLYELSPETFRSLLASFLEVFPESHLYCLWDSSDALLVAAPPGRALSLDRLRTPAVAYELARARLTEPEQVAAFYVGGPAVLRAVAAGGELNTDERPFVEYRAPRDMVEVGRRHGSHHPGVTGQLVLSVVPPAGHPLAGWPIERVLEWRARQLIAGAGDEVARAVLGELRSAGAPGVADRLSSERERGGRDRADAEALAEARARLARGDTEGARTVASPLLATASGTDRLEPLLVLAIAAFASGREAEALTRLREAQDVSPADPRAYTLEARVRLARGDREGARRAVTAGLARAPGDSALVQTGRALDGPVPR